MGGGLSKFLSESDLSDYEIDEWVPEESVGVNRSDAAVKMTIINPEPLISPKEIKMIEDKLDNFEMVALLYLLYENTNCCLQVLDRFVRTGKKEKLLSDWVESEGTLKGSWCYKLIEALCIIQNYQLLKKLGHNKQDLQSKYMPFQCQISCTINKLRKVLYLISERLTKNQTVKFIDHMNDKLKITPPNYSDDYLELYFLLWESIELDMKDILQVFKSMELELCYDQLSTVLGNLNPEPNNDYLLKLNEIDLERIQMGDGRTTTTKDNTFLATGTLEDNTFFVAPGTAGICKENSMLDTNKYPVDVGNPGVVLIINQEEFFTEPLEKYRHLLHENKDEIQLSNRQGTEVDKERLRVLFKRMNFKVIVYQNLTHYDMIAKIEQVADDITNESSFVVCILSHGSNGVVYGANSCKVEVSRIEHIMCKRNKRLAGKPKVLILQSCQGERCQTKEDQSIDDSSHNATDGASKIPTADVLTFWATIPGYAAIRNTRNGSWFIQALCDQIEASNLRYHLLDICTQVNDRVTHREWKEANGTNVMVPMLVSTLTKPFYLPPLKD